MKPSTREAVRDLLGVVGFLAIVYGVAMVSYAAGLVVGGVMLLVFAVRAGPRMER